MNLNAGASKLYESIYIRGKASVKSKKNQARKKEETLRHYAPCKTTARYYLNCSVHICDGLGRLDFCNLVIKPVDFFEPLLIKLSGKLLN